jgi:hypothetical protein
MKKMKKFLVSLCIVGMLGNMVPVGAKLYSRPPSPRPRTRPTIPPPIAARIINQNNL